MEEKRFQDARGDALSGGSIGCAPSSSDPLALALAPVSAAFSVVTVEDTTFACVDRERRAAGGDDAIGILYDVSPPASSQELADELARYPLLALCDHHGGAAPVREALGGELTGAEQVVRDLLRMCEAGIFEREPRKLVGVTNSMNIDPDSLVCRFLIAAFCDPALRRRIWEPKTRELLIEAARFGDTTFFGGLDIPKLDYAALTPPVKLAFTMLQLINAEKAKLVVRAKLADALVASGLRQAARDRAAASPGISDIQALHQVAREAALSGSADTWLTAALGERRPTEQGLRQSLAESARAAGLDAPAQEEFVAAGVERFVFENLSRSRVKEVFVGKPRADLFGPAHAALFDTVEIGCLFANISAKVDRMLSDPDSFRTVVERFIADLKHVHELGKSRTTTFTPPGHPEREVSLTLVRERMDREPSKRQAGQRHPIWDWLREACAAFGTPWLHVMDRPHMIVVSARFAAPGEQRPEIDLSEPSAVERLLELEAAAAARAGAAPVTFLIKANLWLPTARPHFTSSEVVELLHDCYASICKPADPALPPLRKPLFAEVAYGQERAPFDGSRQLLRHFVKPVQPKP